MATAEVVSVVSNEDTSLREVDRATAIAAVQALHERNVAPLPYGMGPCTTPATFAFCLRRLRLKLKPQFS